MRVGQVSPGANFVDTTSVLELHGVANVGELSVLEKDKVVLGGELGQLGRERGIEVFKNIDVRLEHADFGAQFVGQTQKLGAGRHVGSNTEIGLL